MSVDILNIAGGGGITAIVGFILLKIQKRLKGKKVRFRCGCNDETGLSIFAIMFVDKDKDMPNLTYPSSETSSDTTVVQHVIDIIDTSRTPTPKTSSPNLKALAFELDPEEFSEAATKIQKKWRRLKRQKNQQV
jgi:hypothetical protein